MGYTRTWSIVNGRQLVEVTGTPWVAASDMTAHLTDTTAVHGIADTAVLATDAELAAHAADTTAIHGIADTAALATQTDVDDAIAAHVLAEH